MMDICSGPYAGQHEEVCYDADVCPVCAEVEARESKEEELNDKISDLEAKITELEEAHDSQID